MSQGDLPGTYPLGCQKVPTQRYHSSEITVYSFEGVPEGGIHKEVPVGGIALGNGWRKCKGKL